MHGATRTFEQIETRPLNLRQKSLIAAAIIGTALEFFDFFIIGFILTIIVEPWGLTFGQSAFLLLTGGIGAIVGSFVFGALADKIGRRPCFIATVLTFSLATGALALVPEGNWVLFGILRLVAGFGVGGLITVDVPLVQEFVPSRRRGFLGALVVVFIPIGVLLASVLAASLGPVIGWRGLVLLGLVPALLSLYIRFAVSESPQWLIHRGRYDDARRSVAWVLQIPPEDVKLPEEVSTTPPKWSHIFRYPRSIALTWISSLGNQTALYGVTLWGPTLLALQLGVTPARAAFLFVFISLSGFFGRIVFAVGSDRFGRRPLGIVAFLGGALALISTGLTHDVIFAGVSLFFVMMILTYFLVDGGLSVALPYWGEVFPTDLRASGVGAAYGFGGIGKILGPAILVLISGAGTVVTPQATVSAIQPAFIFLGCVAALAGLAYIFFGIETRGKSLEELDAALASQSSNPVDVIAPAAGTDAVAFGMDEQTRR